MIESGIVIALIALAGTIYTAWRQYRQTPAQKDRDVMENYRALLDQYRTRIDELAKVNDELEKELHEEREARRIGEANQVAVIKKLGIEHAEELTVVRRELRNYQVGYAEVRRLAVKYVPEGILIPEVNGRATKDIK